MKTEQTQIRKKVLVPLAVLKLAVLAVLVCVIYSVNLHHLTQDHLQSVQGTRRILDETIKQDAALFTSLAELVGNDPALQEAFLAGDRQGLMQKAEPEYAMLKSQHNITHLYFHTLDGICFLRVHRPSRFGDAITRNTLATAMRENRICSDVEIGPLGMFTLRTVYPWYVNGKKIGYLELGEETDRITHQLKKALCVDFIVVLNKSMLDKARFEKSLEVTGRSGDWDRFENHVIISNTLGIMPKTFTDWLRKECLEKKACTRAKMLRAGNKKYMAGCFPVSDAAGTRVGKMYIFRDVTESISQIFQLVAFNALLLLIATGMIFGFFFVYLGRIQRHLETIYRNQQIEILHRRFAESQLAEAKQRADAANMAKSRFLANMSHELRTPMNAIIGFTNLMACEDLNTEQTDYIQTIQASSHHLLDLINDVLDISKIEAGKEQILMAVCSLHEMLNQLADLMKPTAEAKGIEFTVQIRRDVPEQIITDAKHLYQCLINLVGNAIKFTEEGSVTLSAGLIDSEIDRLLYLEVQDTGIGVPADRLEKIFESFEQASTDTGIKYGGSGLGLTISRRLIEMMGGTLTVDSTEGVGTTFTILLKLQCPAPQTTVA